MFTPGHPPGQLAYFHERTVTAMTQQSGGRRAIVELGAAQSVDTLRCLISHVSPSGTKVSR